VTRSRTVKIVVVVVIVALVGPVVLAVLARVFVVEAFKIPSGAMMPTLVPGDHLFVAKSHYGLLGNAPQPGEIAVFRYPRDRTKDFIKRIVGIAGDVIEMRQGALHRNGAPVPRCSLGETTYDDRDSLSGEARRQRAALFLERLGDVVHLAMYSPEGAVARDETWTVRPGEVFVLGDNRDNSHDSRYWGGVPLDDLKGRATSIWWSSTPGRAGTDLHAPPRLTGPPAQALARCLAELRPRG
jgi:signal peptidase I